MTGKDKPCQLSSKTPSGTQLRLPYVPPLFTSTFDQIGNLRFKVHPAPEGQGQRGLFKALALGLEEGLQIAG